MKALSVLLLLLICVQPANADNDVSRLWDKMLPKFRKALELKDQQDKAPESSLFRKDKGSTQEDLNDLLDEAVGILATSDTQIYRLKIQSLEKEILEANNKIVEYEEKRVSAPSEKPAWKAWENSKEDYDSKIQDQKSHIKKREKDIAQVKQSLREELRTFGLDISTEQVDFLLSTVVGDNVIEVIVAFDNVKALTVQLEQLMVQSGENIETARRYYGMYTVLLEMLDRMYQTVIQNIDFKYVPRIEGGRDERGKKVEGIIPKTQKLTKETEKLLQKNSSSKNRDILSANLSAQKLTLQAANLYLSYLEKQRSDLVAAKLKLAPDLAAAQNTYETVKVTSELVAMMRSGQNLFDALKNIQVPELRVFENLEMKREFEKLTVQLKSGTGPS